MSGTYVYSTPVEVAALNLVSGQDGVLSGSLQSATANDRQQIAVQSVTLSGLIHDNAITLSTPAPLLGSSTTFSGTRSGDEITLTFTTRSGVSNVAFHRSSPQEFARLTDELRQRQQQLAGERREQEAMARTRADDDAMRTAIPAFSSDLERLAADYTERAPRLDAVSAQFETLTEQAREAARRRDREPDGVRQGQLSVYISQVSVETTQLNIQVEGAQREFEQDRATVQGRLADANVWCQRTQDSLCARLQTAATAYNVAATARAAGFGRAAAAYARAEAEQSRL